MRYLICILLSNFLIYQPALATLNNVDKTQIFNKNLLANGGFENGKAQWTPNDTADFAVTTTAPMVGSTHATWDADASTDTLLSTAVSIPAGFYGRNGVASCLITVASGTATHTLQAYDGSNILASAAITSSTTPTRTSVNFIFPSSGSISLRVYANADEPSVAIDDCYLGPSEGYNTSQVSQATFVGSAYFATTTNCAGWTASTTSLAAFSTDADCPGPTVEFNPGPGTIQTTDNNLPQFTVYNLPPGNYQVIIEPSVILQSTTNVACFAINDGTTTSGRQCTNHATGQAANGLSIIGQFSYTVSGNKTFSLFGAASTGSVSVPNDASLKQVNFKIYRFPTTQETAYTADTTNWRVDANISGANPSLGTANVATYTGITNASLTLTNNATATATAQITCATTTAPSGTTCTAADESVGVSFTIPRAGNYKACASFGQYVSGDSIGDAVNTTFQLVETPTNAQTISQEGKDRVNGAWYNNVAGSADHVLPRYFCGDFKFDSIGQKAIRVFYEQLVGSTPTNSYITGDALSSAGQRDIRITVWAADQSFPAPNLVNSVVAGYSGVTQIQRVRVAASCSASPCTLVSSTEGVSSVTRGGTGLYVLNFVSGTWPTDTFTCNCTSRTAGAFVCYNTSSSTTTWAFSMGTHIAAADGGFDINCIGPK